MGLHGLARTEAPPQMPVFSQTRSVAQTFLTFVLHIVLNIQSKDSAWGVSNYVSPYEWISKMNDDLQQHWEDLVARALQLCKPKGDLLDSTAVNEFHKLDKDIIDGDTYYAQHCGSIRPAYCVRSASNKREFKIYFGQGHELDHAEVRGCVFYVKNYHLLGAMLHVLGYERGLLSFDGASRHLFFHGRLPAVAPEGAEASQKLWGAVIGQTKEYSLFTALESYQGVEFSMPFV